MKTIRPSEILNTIRSSLQDALEAAGGSGPGKVLLAEDNPVNRMLATRLLEKRGYSVVAVVDGRAAVAALDEGYFDLVLMDVQMPEMDGFQATEEIRRREIVTGGHIPIVAMTAHALKGDRERCLAAGMDGYIAKPIRTAELFWVIESARFDPAQRPMQK